MKIIIDGNEYINISDLEKVISILKNNGNMVYIDEDLYILLNKENRLPQNSNYEVASNAYDEANLMVSIGGDGTFLKAARKIGNRNIPILGVNAGRLGFLSSANINDFQEAYEKLDKRKFVLEPRTLLHVETSRELSDIYNCALNDVAILKQDSASMITIEVYLDNEFLSAYEVDGLIIATPTGSTAYSLSVGGPVVLENLPCFIVSPIASHSLTSRPLVVSSSSVLDIRVQSRSGNFLLSLDGQSIALSQNEGLRICKASYNLNLVRLHGSSSISTLRNKLQWGIDPRRRK